MAETRVYQKQTYGVRSYEAETRFSVGRSSSLLVHPSRSPDAVTTDRPGRMGIFLMQVARIEEPWTSAGGLPWQNVCPLTL